MKKNQKIALDYIKSFYGVPYRWGGSNPMEGFDCSGFVIEYGQAGDALPGGDWTALGLFTRLKSKGKISNRRRVGDLVFYGKNVENIYHVEIVISKNQAVGAGNGNRNMTSLKAAMKQGAYIKVRPFLFRKDIIGYGRLY